jgi:hypothetical protein
MRQVIALCLGFALYGAAAQAGPPLLCHPFAIGDARSLPWGAGSDWNSPSAACDIRRLVADTLELLTPGAPVIVRMETLRRATIYSGKDSRVASALLSQLMARILNAEAGSRPDALAWFDAGYLVETYKQFDLAYQWKMLGAQKPANPAEGLDGREWVAKAIGLGGDRPAMEFAASLMQGNWPNEHLRRALAEASDGSLVARNLVQFGGGAKTLAEMRARYGK